MTWRMFLGGPLDHQWRDIDDRGNWFVPVMPKVSWTVSDVIGPPQDWESETIRYDRQRLHHPAWRILLTFYVAGDPALALRRGDPMPGWVHGVEMEQSRLCRVCRAREASWCEGLCYPCWLNEVAR